MERALCTGSPDLCDSGDQKKQNKRQSRNRRKRESHPPHPTPLRIFSGWCPLHDNQSVEGVGVKANHKLWAWWDICHLGWFKDRAKTCLGKTKQQTKHKMGPTCGPSIYLSQSVTRKMVHCMRRCPWSSLTDWLLSLIWCFHRSTACVDFAKCTRWENSNESDVRHPAWYAQINVVLPRPYPTTRQRNPIMWWKTVRRRQKQQKDHRLHLSIKL